MDPRSLLRCEVRLERLPDHFLNCNKLSNECMKCVKKIEEMNRSQAKRRKGIIGKNKNKRQKMAAAAKPEESGSKDESVSDDELLSVSKYFSAYLSSKPKEKKTSVVDMDTINELVEYLMKPAYELQEEDSSVEVNTEFESDREAVQRLLHCSSLETATEVDEAPFEVFGADRLYQLYDIPPFLCGTAEELGRQLDYGDGYALDTDIDWIYTRFRNEESKERYVQRLLLHLMSLHPDDVLPDKINTTLFNMSRTTELAPVWHHMLADVTAMLLNLGASFDALFPPALQQLLDFDDASLKRRFEAAGDSAKNQKFPKLKRNANKGYDEFVQRRLETVLSAFSGLLRSHVERGARCGPKYSLSSDDAIWLMFVLLRVSLDRRCESRSSDENLLTSIVEYLVRLIPEDEWLSKVHLMAECGALLGEGRPRLQADICSWLISDASERNTQLYRLLGLSSLLHLLAIDAKVSELCPNATELEVLTALRDVVSHRTLIEAGYMASPSKLYFVLRLVNYALGKTISKEYLDIASDVQVALDCIDRALKLCGANVKAKLCVFVISKRIQATKQLNTTLLDLMPFVRRPGSSAANRSFDQCSDDADSMTDDEDEDVTPVDRTADDLPDLEEGDPDNPDEIDADSYRTEENDGDLTDALWSDATETNGDFSDPDSDKTRKLESSEGQDLVL